MRNQTNQNWIVWRVSVTPNGNLIKSAVFSSDTFPTRRQLANAGLRFTTILITRIEF